MDAKAVLDRVNLVDLIEGDLGQPAKVSGKYTFWACPFHDDSNPSFAVTSDRYYCFGCRASGDAIDWLTNYRGLGFIDALGLLSGEKVSLKSSKAILQRQVEPVEVVEPELDLQSAWNEIIDTCRGQLWSDKGKQARDYLHARGLTDDTLQGCTARLGYSEGQKIADIWVDRGVVIPNFTLDKDGAIDRIAYIKIRRGKSWVYKPNDRSKYRKLYGASQGLYGADLVRGSDLVFVTEGELDALLLRQEVGQYVGVCTLGSASERLNLGRWGSYLSSAKWYFIAYDNDLAGDTGFDYWTSWSGRAVRVKVPTGKDITDAYLAGVDLAEWVFSIIREKDGKQ